MSKVYWITGLAGAGKSTIGKCLYERLKQEKENVVFFDGDELREVFGNDLGYTKEERLKCSMRYSRMCKLMAKQQIDVVCCTISMFHQVRDWNRKNIEGYTEIYIKVPLRILKERDQKGLYSGAYIGGSGNVVGMDLELETPTNPDIVLENTGEYTPQQLAAKLLHDM